MRQKAILLAVALALVCSTASAQEEAYKLGKGDKVQILTFGHEDLTGEFEVDANGFVKFPLLGRVRAEGLSLTELEEALKAPLGERFIVNPKISANILEYSPVFVLGDVAAPAMYPYEPGMTVLHAVALAGGYGMREPIDVAIQLIDAKEGLRLVFNQYRAAQAQRSRLLAERDNLDEITFAVDIEENRNDPYVADLINSEVSRFQTRREALEGEIDVLNKQKDLFRQEISALQGQLRANRKQVELTEIELRDLQELSEKGLARRPQLLVIQRSLAGFEGERTQLGAYIARARQQIARTDQEILNRETGYRDQVITELREVQVLLEDLQLRLKTSRERLDQFRLRGSHGVSGLHEEFRDNFVITRNRGPEPEEIAATEKTKILPGDVVRVPFPDAEDPVLPERAGGDTGSVTYASDGRVRLAPRAE